MIVPVIIGPSVSHAGEDTPCLAVHDIPGCSGGSCICGIRDGTAFGFPIVIEDAGFFVAVEVRIRWNATVASRLSSLSGGEIPDDTVALNGRKNIRLVPQKNIIAASGNGMSVLTGSDRPGFFSATCVKTTGETGVHGDGLLWFASFRAKSGFERTDSLIVTVEATLFGVDGSQRECFPVHLTVYPWRPPALIASPRSGDRLTAGDVCNILWTNTRAVNLMVEYTINDGVSWQSVGEKTDAAEGRYLWTVPDVVSSVCRIRLRDTADDYPDSSGIPVNIVGAPTISLFAKTPARDGAVPVVFDIREPSGQPVTLLCEYSKDNGANWNTASLDRSTAGIPRTGYRGMMVWHARHDLDGFTGAALFRARPISSGLESADVITIGIEYNTRPTVTVDPIPENLKGNITLFCAATDAEGDSTAITLFYSTDGGAAWSDATTTIMRAVAKPGGPGLSFTWISVADLPDRLCRGILLRVDASDAYGRTSKIIGPVNIDNRLGTLNGFPEDTHRGVPVLALHSVQYTSQDNTKLSVTPEMIDRLLGDLKHEGYTFLSMTEYLDYIEFGTPVPERSILLTFDDGYRTMCDILMPILEKYGAHASMNLIASRIGNAYFLTQSQISQMAATGLVDFQTHSFNLHDYKDGKPLIFPFFYENELRYSTRIKNDISMSSDYIEKLTGERPQAFVVPYGIGSEAVEGYSRDAGMRAVFYIGNDVVNRPGDFRYHLERVSVNRYNCKIIGKLISSNVFPLKTSVEKASVTAVPPVVSVIPLPCKAIVSSLAIGDDNVMYIGSWDGNLYVFDTDGTVRWRCGTGAGIVSTPALGPDGAVYIGSYDRKLYCISPDGRHLWDYDGWAPLISSPSIGPNGDVYIGSSDGGIVAVKSGGITGWNFRSGDVVFSSPAVIDDGSIIVGTLNNQVLSLAPDGYCNWLFRTEGGVESSPAVGRDGMVYFGCMDGNIYALDAAGRLQWKYRTGGWIDSSPVIDAAGNVFIGSSDGNLYSFTPRGTLRWCYRMEGRVEATPAIDAEGTIYTGTLDGYLYAVASDGLLKWRLRTGGSIDSSPVISDRGILYTVSSDGYLYGIDTETGTGAIGYWPMFKGNARRSGSVSHHAAKKYTAPIETSLHEIPYRFSLGKPTPNPFNPRTVIHYSLPVSSRALVAVYTVTGQKAAVLVDENKNAGAYSVQWDGSGFPSGVYIVRLEACGQSSSVKALLVK